MMPANSWRGLTGVARKVSSFCILLALCGCSHWSHETRVEESVYQTLGAIDAAQSVQATRRYDCYSEADALTRSIIGPHPSAGAVIGYRAALGALHFAVTDALERDDGDIWLKRAWQLWTIGIEAHAVYVNFQVGATPFGVHPARSQCRA